MLVDIVSNCLPYYGFDFDFVSRFLKALHVLDAREPLIDLMV